jgi:uncharacterized RDD family membrane protein YckC
MGYPHDRCPHCHVLLSGVKCQACGHIDSKSVFINNHHRCPKCGNHVRTAAGEPIKLNFPAFFRRLTAHVIDVIVIGSPLAVLFGFAVEIPGYAAAPISLVCLLAYWTLMEGGPLQATIGKYVMGLKVTDSQGGKVTFARALGRATGKFASAWIFGIGCLMILFTDKERGLHDMLSKTLVVKRPGRERAANSSGQESCGATDADAQFAESDNMGTRHDTSEAAVAYWMGERLHMTRKDPFALFTFERAEDARNALLELPCIHVARDSGELICTEPLIFGAYPVDNEYEAIICGDDLTIELWEQARQCFTRHGGKKKNELAPTRRIGPNKPAQAAPDEVDFLGEEVEQKDGNTYIYRLYKGNDAESAKAFLRRNPVTRHYYYLIVETPDGTYCRDIQGVYKGE